MLETRSKSLSIVPVEPDAILEQVESGTVYGILDSCDDPDVFAKVCEMDQEQVDCLYSGDAKDRLANIAPYLVAVDVALLEWVEQTLVGRPWGVLLTSSEDLETIRRHLKKFLMVEDPDGEELYFRFYDPRVLATFLATSSQDELKTFFGPISRYLIPDETMQFHSFQI